VNPAQRRRIANAIASAEAGTSGRIAVRIVPGGNVDAFERAKREFVRAGLHAHAGRNAALVLVAPAAKRFAAVGDRELHARVGDRFWEELVGEMRPQFARGAVTDAIVHAVRRIGEALNAHFPLPEDRA